MKFESMVGGSDFDGFNFGSVSCFNLETQSASSYFFYVEMNEKISK